LQLFFCFNQLALEVEALLFEDAYLLGYFKAFLLSQFLLVYVFVFELCLLDLFRYFLYHDEEGLE
jgi:hypothetical protein